MQGVGFRPFVYALATGLGLTGLVGNDLDGVFAEVEGPEAAVGRVPGPAGTPRRPRWPGSSGSAPGLIAPVDSAAFVIAASEAQTGLRRTLVSADTATCADCLRELADPADRRHEYPFINCTNCGPRFTIVRDVPYDRPLTTMAPFAMCERCAAEYHDPADRRFHAQPTCCPACGPRLRPRRRQRRPACTRPPNSSATAVSSPSRAWAGTTWPPTPPASRPSPRSASASTARTSRSR